MGVIDSEKRYLKINLDNTFIDKAGVHVSYDIFKSHEDRERKKVVDNEVDMFIHNYNVFIREQSLIGKAIIDENNITAKLVENKDSSLPSELLQCINNIENANADFNTVTQTIGTAYSQTDEVIKKFKDYELLKSLGFKIDWFTNPVKEYVTLTQISGPYLKQDFTHKSMYNELKKTLKGQKYEDV